MRKREAKEKKREWGRGGERGGDASGHETSLVTVATVSVETTFVVLRERKVGW